MHSELSWFFVAGAQKAGTTTLHEWLSKSSEIALPWSKETHFFMDEKLFSWGDQWYLKQFQSRNSQSRVIGEVDPEYMYFPECAERMKGFVQAPKLIFVLRDPVARAYSNYLMSVRWGYEPLSFAEALSVEEERMRRGGRFSQIHHGYLARGLYAEQIARFRKLFPESRVLILLFDDLFASQEIAAASLTRIFEFLEVSPEGLSVDVTVRKNQATEPRFVFLRNFIYGQGKLKKQVGKLILSRKLKIRIMKFLDLLNSKPILSDDVKEDQEKDQIPPFVYKRLIHELGQLERMVKVDVSHWIVDYEKRLTGSSQ